MSVHATRAHEFIVASEQVTGPRDATFWALKLWEESGEVAKAFNRASGLSRRSGPMSDVGMELAQAVACAYILAEKLGIDLDEAAMADFGHIMTRGFKA